MRLKRIPILLGMLVAASSAAGFKYWDEERQAAIVERQRTDLADRLIGTVRLVEDYSLPGPEVSQRHQELLQQIKQSESQYIVFPPSAPKFRAGLDLTARIAIARTLAQLVEAETGVPVPDPALVFEAYQSPRRLDPELVPVRLRDGNARWVITGTAWHDGHGKMSIRLARLPMKAASSDASPSFERTNISISDEMPPEAAFHAVAAEALHALGLQPPAPAQVKEDAPAELPLPASPIDAEAAQKSLTEGLWLQHMIGVLHHSIDTADPRPRERVFERALSGLVSLSPDSGDHAVLKARTLLYLGRPRAAHSFLEHAPDTPEARALLAYMRGDLPALKRAAPEIKREIPRMIAEVELTGLRIRFGEEPTSTLHTEAERLAKLVPNGWQELLALFALHQSAWTMPAPSALKPLLDRDFPVAGYRVEDVVRSKTALGASPTDEETVVDLITSPLVHSDKWRSTHATTICCGQGSRQFARYNRVQYLDLIDALVEGELSLHLEFLLHVQGRPEYALRRADAFDRARYRGINSQIMASRMQALMAISANEIDKTRAAQMMQETRELAKRILSWDSAQSFATGQAIYVDGRAGARQTIPVPTASGYSAGVDTSVFDFPRRAFWASRASYGVHDRDLAHALRRDACRLTVDNFDLCRDYLKQVRSQSGEAQYRKEVAKLVESRFVGSASRAVLLSDLKLEDDDAAGAETLLEQAMASGAGQQAVYAALGDLRIRDGRYAEAVDTLLALPALRAEPDSTVSLSKYLEERAVALLRRGALPQARQLLEVAARYRDGSHANLAAIAQLAMIEERYDSARKVLQDQYQRYHSPSSAGKLVSLFFMMGEADQGWGALTGAGGQPYETCSVGLRVAGADTDAIAAWSAQHADSVKNYWQSMWVTFHALSVDRPASAIREIYAVDAKARPRMRSYKVREPPFELANAAALAQTDLPQPAYVEGYAAIKERNYAAAAQALRPVYFPEVPAVGAKSEPPWQLLPYLALAAAKTGSADDAFGILERLDASLRVDVAKQRPTGAGTAAGVPRFQRHLTLAIGYAFKGNHGRAVSEVKSAQASIAGYGGMLESGYALAEILERLTEETGHTAYMAIALDYARAFQRYQPWAGWAYAFEARYGPAGPARHRAGGIALKLHPKSQWLSELDKHTLAQARQWAAVNRWPGKSSQTASDGV